MEAGRIIETSAFLSMQTSDTFHSILQIGIYRNNHKQYAITTPHIPWARWKSCLHLQWPYPYGTNTPNGLSASKYVVRNKQDDYTRSAIYTQCPASFKMRGMKTKNSALTQYFEEILHYSFPVSKYNKERLLLRLRWHSYEEIAGMHGVSRQAVHIGLTRVVNDFKKIRRKLIKAHNERLLCSQKQ